MSDDLEAAGGEPRKSTRRDVIKKGAIAGGVAVWAAPAISTLTAGPAFAAESTLCSGTVRIDSVANTVGAGPTIRHRLNYNALCTGQGCSDNPVYPQFTWVFTPDSPGPTVSSGGGINDDDIFINCSGLIGWSITATITHQCQAGGVDPTFGCSVTFHYTPGAGCSTAGGVMTGTTSCTTSYP